MRIALIQQSASEDKSANIEKGLSVAKEAAKNGADIVCFAELAFTQFYPQNHANNNNLSLAETIPGQTTIQFSKIASEFGVVIILNLFEKDGEKTYDSSPVIDTDGTGFGQGRIIEGGYASDHKHDLDRMQFFYRLDEQFVEYNFAGIISKIHQMFARA